MIKKLSIFAVAWLVAWNCSLVKEDRTSCSFTAPVNVNLSGFSVSQEDLHGTKATSTPESYSGVNAVTLAFYQGNTEVYKCTQLQDDATTYSTFGSFNLSLRMGSYTMVAVAYTTKNGSTFVLTRPTLAAYTGDHAYETFTCTQSVEIEDTAPVDVSATLDRIVTMLSVISTDGKTANATNVRMTFSAGGKSFNPTTGLATVNTGFINTVGISTDVGDPSTSSTAFFLLTDEQTLNVTIDVLDASSNVLFSKLVENVPFKRNRKTKLMGSIYSAVSSGSFLLDTDWIDPVENSF